MQRESFALAQFSIQATAGALLQFAKQSISLVYSKPENAQGGGKIGVLSRGEVIWQARNQALHWEDGKFSPRVVACFTELAKIDPVFANYNKRSLAFEVVRLLGWKEKADFESDLLSL
jgi:hypothetical protein